MSASLILSLGSLVFLFSFALSLFIFIVLRRIVIDRLSARFKQSYQEIEKDILEAISRLSPEFSREVAERYKNHPAVLAKILLDYGNAITGEGREQLRIIFDRAVKARCLKSLASRRTARRLKNARLFIIFCGPEEGPVLIRLLKDKPIIKLCVLSALSNTPSPETLDYVFQAFGQDTGPAVRSYFNIMFSLGKRIEPLVKAHLQKPLSSEKLGLLVELVGVIPLHSLSREILSLAGHPDKEIRIRVARALGKLHLPEALEVLIAMSSDEAWEVAAQAAKGLGKLGNPATTEVLVRSLFSPHWHVRYNAGYGLARMGEAGRRRLKEVASQNEDRYARDMSVMVLHELIDPAEAA
ncbi:MAG: lyase domain protein repeat-containing protein [Candidatus Aminicenantes bacterium]|nr:lyase domain protein repeat-containing protein [Candidatus Aminicenantes bacterium]